MCGIYGWNYPKGSVGVERRAMVAAILAIANDTRGGDSWGFWNKNNLLKGLGDISTVAVKTVNSDLLMAHTRKATTGGITTENAHPFDIGNIIGAHNGIISNHTELNTKYKRDYSVDSMHLFGHINDGIPFDDIYGYGAIEFIRKNEKDRVYLCKLQAGDLTICGLGKDADNYKGAVWSSNGNHLTQALDTAGIEHFEFKIETGNVYYVENGQVFIQLQKGGKPETMALGTRTDYGSHYWGGHGRNGPRSTPSTGSLGAVKKLTPEEYEQMLQGMTNEEEIEFFKLWAKEEGLDEAVVASLIEADEEMEEESADWPDETTKLSTMALSPESAEIEKKINSLATDAEFDHTKEDWVTVDEKGNMITEAGLEKLL